MTSLEPGPLGNGVASRRFRRELSAEDHHDLAMRRGTLDKSKRMERCLTREAGSARRGTLSTLENNFPTALPMLLAMVEGPDRLPAVEGKQEVLKGKLRVLEADSAEVIALFTEMSAQIISINSEENIIFVTFKTFEEIWKFTTYFTMGFLGQCMENLLLDQDFWLCSLDHEDLGIEISIQEETLNLMYIGLLMQEGSFFASCSSHQMFDSSTSGGDLYLEQGDIALFEPPFLGSGWTVLSLGDGARGTKARPALQPVVPFYQWFLKSCPENILVGSGRPVCDFPLQFARGTCVAAAAYDAEGPDELSLALGDRIIIVGLLVSCFDWFAGKQENTGEVGLVRTCMVKPDQSTCEAPDIFLSREEREFLSLREECLVPHTIALLKKTSHNIMSSVYKLDLLDEDEPPTQPVQNGRMDADERSELKRKVERILSTAKKAKVPPSVVTSNGTHGSESPEVLEPGAPLFSVDPVDEAAGSSQSILFLLDFLDGSVHKPEFGTLYSLSPELLAAAFEGQSDDDELVAYLGVARETARKKRLYWSQSRLCFFLGKLCVGRLKFSQARVYLEEALSVPRDSFTDMLLLASIYASLASIYLMQKNTEKYFALSERIAALLMGYPDCISSLEKDPEVHRFVLKKAVLAHNKMAEARACFLLAKLHRRRGEGASAAPFVERLLVLQVEPPGTPSVKPSQGYLSLGRIYSDLTLPHLSVSAAWRACMQSSTRLADCLSGVGLVLENSSRLFGIHKQEMTVPAQVAPYLVRALAISEDKGGGGGGGGGGGMDQALIQALTLCLSQLFQMHGMLEKAVRSMHTLIDRTSSSRSTVGSTELNGALIWLAWLHINHGEAGAASDILESVLASLPELCTSPQEGLVLNMLGVARRRSGDLRGAAESYRAAAAVCEEFEDAANWAVALANLGLLCLRAGARGLAQRRLEEAVQRFSGLEVNDGHEGNFVPVLLELGGIYVEEGLEERGKIYYEWALLVAMMSNHTEGQLRATRRLCHLYGSVCPDEAQCIIYNEHQLGLLRGRGERGREGDILEAISRLYLSLGTERAYRSALEYTKRSLGICIDLGLREKEAYAWLQAGRIYLLLGQEELVDLYVQVAQDVGLGTGNTVFILGLLEAAGDVFFNGGKDLDRAVSFYRDRALPIAVKTGSVAARLRLCNKLVELLLRLQQCGEAVEFAQTALQLSVSLGDHLNERVAYHRLAAVYHSLSQFELTEHYYLKTLSLCPAPLQFDEETLYYVRVYQTLGDITFYDLKDPFDAAGYYHLALAAAMDLGNKKSQLQLCTRLATIYHNFLVDRELSLFFYQKARGFASDLNIRRINLAPDQQHRSVPQYKGSSH